MFLQHLCLRFTTVAARILNSIVLLWHSESHKRRTKQSMKVQFWLNPKLTAHTTAFSFPLKYFKTFLLPPDVETINRLVCIMCNSSFRLQFYVFNVLKTTVFTKWVPHIKRCPRFYVGNLLLSIASRTLFSSSNFCILSLSLSVTICYPNPKPVKSLKRKKTTGGETHTNFESNTLISSTLIS